MQAILRYLHTLFVFFVYLPFVVYLHCFEASCYDNAGDEN